MNQEFLHSVTHELTNILNYWKTNTIDKKHGGYLGRIDHFNQVIDKSSKGIILNSRILWAFSAASNHYQNDAYKVECITAYQYLQSCFRDNNNGGVYWKVNYLGEPLETKKQTYAQAFTIYSLAEYYKYCNKKEVLEWAFDLFELVEEKTKDEEFDGYIEAFEKNWGSLQDMRLSDKDLNAPKTMNTHLHILEAYTTLFEVTNNSKVEKALKALIDLFLNQFVSENNHFKLFFSKDWKNLSHETSFGHDIEAAWLLLNASKQLNDLSYIKKTEILALKIVDTFLEEAIDQDFGVFNAINQKTNKLDFDRHWWPQAEAIVGLLYVWEITNDKKYLAIANKVWAFIERYIIDFDNGEWYFRVDRHGVSYQNENKVGPWKCPYHNTRACIEIIRKLK